MKPVAILNEIIKLRSGYTTVFILDAAQKIGLFDALFEKKKMAYELALELNVAPEALRRILVVLCRYDVIKIEDDHFTNTDLGNALSNSAQESYSSLVALGPLAQLWRYLPEALREGGPQWDKLGMPKDDTFKSLCKNPQALKGFQTFMNANSIPVGTEIAKFGFLEYHTLLDVGGGMGGVSVQIGLKHQHLHGIIMEVPEVCTLADEYISAKGLTDRFTTAEGDLFKGPYPQGADVALLSWVLHDWNDEHCRTILSNVFHALPRGGTLCVSECILNEDGSGKAYAEVLNIVMLLAQEPGAKERTERQYEALIRSAGFELFKCYRLEGPRDLMFAIKR